MGKHIIAGFVAIKKTLGVRTYVIEMIIVATALVLTALLTKKSMIERIGVVAVFLTFCYIQIAERMEESEQKRKHTDLYAQDKYSVHCYYKLPWFYYGKELCWTIYFIYLGAWSALVGVVVFLLYIPRRRFYRKHHPLR